MRSKAYLAVAGIVLALATSLMLWYVFELALFILGNEWHFFTAATGQSCFLGYSPDIGLWQGCAVAYGGHARRPLFGP